MNYLKVGLRPDWNVSSGKSFLPFNGLFYVLKNVPFSWSMSMLSRLNLRAHNLSKSHRIWVGDAISVWYCFMKTLNRTYPANLCVCQGSLLRDRWKRLLHNMTNRIDLDQSSYLVSELSLFNTRSFMSTQFCYELLKPAKIVFGTYSWVFL